VVPTSPNSERWRVSFLSPETPSRMATALTRDHAEALRLEFVEGQRAVEVFHRIKTLEQGDALGSEVLEQLWELGEGPPGLSFLPVSAASGSYRGCETYLATHLRAPSLVTLFLLFPRPLEEKLLIVAEGLLARLGKKLFKTQDLECGNDLLDPKVVIKSSQPERTQRRLQSSPTQTALLAIYSDLSDAVVSDVGVRATLSKPSIADLRKTAESFSELANAL
jgi:hypothetical protein